MWLRLSYAIDRVFQTTGFPNALGAAENDELVVDLTYGDIVEAARGRSTRGVLPAAPGRRTRRGGFWIASL